MKYPKIILFLLLATFAAKAQQRLIRGTIVENDSITPVPFAYIINKSNGNGTMSDNDGRFNLYSHVNDTLIITYAGFSRLTQAVGTLQKDSTGKVKLVMQKLMFNLAPVTVSTFYIKPYEREYMHQIIDESRVKLLDYANSPISALYMRYSQYGKQVRKLAKIFEQIFVEEEVQKKLSPEILRRLTGDENINYEDFRKYCYSISDEYIMSHEGAELYSKVMECYKRYKKEGR